MFRMKGGPLDFIAGMGNNFFCSKRKNETDWNTNWNTLQKHSQLFWNSLTPSIHSKCFIVIFRLESCVEQSKMVITMKASENLSNKSKHRIFKHVWCLWTICMQVSIAIQHPNRQIQSILLFLVCYYCGMRMNPFCCWMLSSTFNAIIFIGIRNVHTVCMCVFF